jgi:hypothetical protein
MRYSATLVLDFDSMCLMFHFIYNNNVNVLSGDSSPAVVDI